MRMIVFAAIGIGLPLSSIGGLYSLALGTHGGDHCTLEQHAALIGKGYNNVQEAKICNGEQPGVNDRPPGSILLDPLVGKPQPRATLCQTPKGYCPANSGTEGEGCSCMGRDGQQYYGFVKDIY